MTDNVLKATLVVAFSVCVIAFTWKGCSTSTDTVDLQALKQQQTNAVQPFNMAAFREKMLAPLKSKKGFPVTYEDFDAKAPVDQADLKRKIAQLDSLKEYGYVALLLERLAMAQQTDSAYIRAGRQFIASAAMSDGDEEQVFYGLRAQENLQKAKDLNPASIASNIDLALCYLNNPMSAKSPQEAMKPILLLLEVVDKDPDNIEANYLLATSAERTGQIEKAIERYKKLLSLQPQNPEYAHKLEQLYRTSGNLKEAEKYAEIFRKLAGEKTDNH